MVLNMSLLVAIVGLPNVGKSTLFNRMIKSSQKSDFTQAITDKTPGVTRDRNYSDVQWGDKRFTIIDTGGLYFEDDKSDDINIQVREQAIAAMQEADLILHVVDGQVGINPFDYEIARHIRESGKKSLLIVNKIDTHKKKDKIVDFYSIGSEIVPVSGITGYGFEELMDKISSLLPRVDDSAIFYIKNDGIPKIAVVGRPNVGKSTLINSLLSKKRLIVSPTPGTTRDSIDTVCSYYGKKYLFIDTAGIRKDLGRSFYNQRILGRKLSPDKFIERESIMRAIKSIRRADIALILLDVTEGVTSQDQKIAGIVADAGKGAILLLNKWDLIEKPEIEYKNIIKIINRKLWFINYAPILTISGLDKKRTSKIFPLIDEVNFERNRVLSNDELDIMLSEIFYSFNNITHGSKELKFLKISQTGIAPPTFEIYTNRPSIIKDNLTIFAEKIIRSKISFKGTPIRIFFKSH